MKYVEAPERWEGSRGYDFTESVFLAGSITGARNWQAEMVGMLSVPLNERRELVVMNPRRANFDINVPGVAREQIAWEHHHLRKADAILFWFEENTLSPITLFELGVWSERSQQLKGGVPWSAGTARPTCELFVGVHPNFARRFDVVEQLALSRPDITVMDSSEGLADLAALVLAWVNRE